MSILLALLVVLVFGKSTWIGSAKWLARKETSERLPSVYSTQFCSRCEQLAHAKRQRNRQTDRDGKASQSGLESIRVGQAGKLAARTGPDNEGGG